MGGIEIASIAVRGNDLHHTLCKSPEVWATFKCIPQHGYLILQGTDSFNTEVVQIRLTDHSFCRSSCLQQFSLIFKNSSFRLVNLLMNWAIMPNSAGQVG